MPLYEYQCDACGFRFEVIQRFSDAPIESCQSCGGPVRKLLSSPAIQFKGSGWYITDYAKKGASASESAAAKADGKGSEKSTGDKGTSDASSSKPAPASGGGESGSKTGS